MEGMGWEGESKEWHCEENGYFYLCSWVFIFKLQGKDGKLPILKMYPQNIIYSSHEILYNSKKWETQLFYQKLTRYIFILWTKMQKPSIMLSPKVTLHYLNYQVLCTKIFQSLTELQDDKYMNINRKNKHTKKANKITILIFNRLKIFYNITEKICTTNIHLRMQL